MNTKHAAEHSKKQSIIAIECIHIGLEFLSVNLHQWAQAWTKLINWIDIIDILVCCFHEHDSIHCGYCRTAYGNKQNGHTRDKSWQVLFLVKGLTFLQLQVLDCIKQSCNDENQDYNRNVANANDPQRIYIFLFVCDFLAQSIICFLSAFTSTFKFTLNRKAYSRPRPCLHFIINLFCELYEIPCEFFLSEVAI